MKRLSAFALPLLAGCALAAPVVRIHLPAQIEVENQPVTLGQVAAMSSTDLDLLRRLVGLPIGPAPAAGQVRDLQRDGLQRWVARRLGLQPEQVRWEGAEQARVSTRSRTVPGREVAAAAVRALSAWLADHPAGAHAAVAGELPRDLLVDDQAVQLEARPPAGPLRERMLVWVEVRQGPHAVRSIPVRLEVRLAAPLSTDTRPPRQAPVVQRGDWAWLHSRVGPVLTRVRVEVLQDGRPGDRVRVRTSGAAESLLASVIAEGRLEVAR